MTGNTELGPPPEGITFLKCDTTGDIYVVNEVLNFYQRKLRVLGKTVAVNLAHHIFDITVLAHAVKVLVELWD